MKRTGLALAFVAASSLTTGCSSAGEATSSSSTSPPTTAATALSLVVIGDSIPFNSQQDLSELPGLRHQVRRGLGEGDRT